MQPSSKRPDLPHGVGLYDRDYMKRTGRKDPYYDRLFEPPPSRAPAPVTRRSRRRGSAWWWAVFLLVSAIGLLLLPKLTTDGRHWTFWLI
jgi:hypothetical protein